MLEDDEEDEVDEEDEEDEASPPLTTAWPVSVGGGNDNNGGQTISRPACHFDRSSEIARFSQFGSVQTVYRLSFPKETECELLQFLIKSIYK